MESLDISTLNIPDFSDYDIANYPYLASYASRSCPYQCKFCSETVQWGNYRKKEVKKIVAELISLSSINNYQIFYLCDSLINPVINELTRELAAAKKSIYWECCIRVDKDLCDQEKVIAWRKGGFYRAKIGIESGSQRILDEMNKKITIEQMKQSLFNLASAGIKTLIFIIVGFPSETEEDFQLTLDFIEELQDYIYEVEVAPFEYYFAGQSYSEEWQKERKVQPLYPEWTNQMLFGQTWILDQNPTREETYKRLNRLYKHLKSLKIPNIYSLSEIYDADGRWNLLHRNAVPSLFHFLKRDQQVNESMDVKKIVTSHKTLEDSDFTF